PGGPLVHLARTGEHLDLPEAAPALARHESNRPPHITAGPPPRPTTSGRGSRPDAPADRDWLPDLAARLADDESLLGGDRPRPGTGPRAVAPPTMAASLVRMLALAFYVSPPLRHALGLEPARKVDRDRLTARPDSGSEPPPITKGAAEKPAEPVAGQKENKK